MPLNFKKDIMPHALGILIFYLFVLFYFSPIVFDGKIMFQYDILQWEGAAKELLDYRKTTGNEGLWSNRMFGGMPAYLVSLEIPGDITNALIKVITLGLPHPINSLFFGMVCMYILLLSYRVRPEFSIAGAIAFAFNTFHLISLEAGHNAKIWAICLIPLILAGIHLTFQGKKLLGLALFALGLMLQLKFNHLQITYYTVLIVLIYGLVQLIWAFREKAVPHFAKTIGILVIGAILAVGANLTRFMTVLEYGKYSTRGASNIGEAADSQGGLDKDYAFNWSQGKLETLTLLVPYIYGGASTEPLPKNSQTEQALRANGVDNAQLNGFINQAPTYWGEQPGTGGPIYGGGVMLFLLVLGIIFAPKKDVYIFVSIAVLSILLAWGKNLAWFNYALFDFLPGYNKFRAVTMAFSMTLFAIPVLGSLGLEHAFKNSKDPKLLQKLGIAFLSTGGLALLFWLGAGMFGFRGTVDANLPDWLVEPLQNDRKAILRSSALQSLIFIGLAAGLVFAAFKEKLSAQLAGIGIALLIGLDLWIVNKRYVNEESFQFNPSEQYFAATPADKAIQKDAGHFRVLNLDDPFNKARSSYYFNSIGGYHGAKMKRYQELVENALGQEIQNFIQKAQAGDFAWQEIPILNMLNTKYIVAGSAENAVFQNPASYGAAWFPTAIKTVTSNDDEMEAIKTLPSADVAVVNSNEFGNPKAGSGQVLSVKAENPSQLTYEVEADRAGMLVFSEIFYPVGWKALVDGQETAIIRANYLLRAIEVPQGKHTIELRFEPDSFYNTKLWTVLFQYLVVLVLIGGIVLYFRSSKS
jgi:hypothetical protein